MSLSGKSAAAWACIAIASVSGAHHSYAMFDMAQVKTVSGAVKSLEWTSPHVWLFVDVTAGAGAPATYAFESVSPSQLQRDYGWDRRALKVGDKVSVDYAPLKSGNPGGALVKITLADGSVLATRFSGARQP